MSQGLIQQIRVQEEKLRIAKIQVLIEQNELDSLNNQLEYEQNKAALEDQKNIPPPQQ